MGPLFHTRSLLILSTLTVTLTLAVTPVTAEVPGDSENMTLLAKWGYGPCFAVAADENYVYVANGSVLEIMIFTTGGDPIAAGHVTAPAPIFGIAVTGGMAYLAVEDAGLWIVDLGDPSHPAGVGSIATPGDAFDVDVTGNYACVCADGDGLRIIDISDPGNPTEVGFYDTDGYATKVVVDGSYAYVADGYAGPYSYGRLSVIDLSNPDAPFEAGSWEYTQSTHVYAWGVEKNGNRVYLTFDHGEIVVLDVTDPTDPQFLGSFTEGMDIAYDIVIAGGYAYVANSWYGLGVYDLAAPDWPVPETYVDTPVDARRVAVQGNRAYVADREGGMHVCDITDPTTASHLYEYSTPGNSMSVAVADGYAFVTDDYHGLRVLDIRNPLYPREVGFCPTPGHPLSVEIADDLAYMTAGGAGLRIIDISDPINPVELGYFETDDSAEGLAVNGTIVYVTEYGEDMVVIDVSEPTFPVSVGSFTSTLYIRNMCVAGDYLYAASHSFYNDLLIFDISTPTSPTNAGVFNYDGTGWDVEVKDEYLYLAADYEGLYIFELIGPATPSLVGQFDASGAGLGVTLRGSYAHLGFGSYARIVDITDPAVPAPAGYYDVGSIAWKGAMKGDLFVVPGHGDGVYVFRNENLLPNDVPAETPRAGGTRLTNHPNPFNPQTTLYFLLPETSRVRLAVHDLSGRLLTVLVNDARQAGEHAVDWNGRDSGGRELASGVYLARLETERGVRTQKLVLAR